MERTVWNSSTEPGPSSSRVKLTYIAWTRPKGTALSVSFGSFIGLVRVMVILDISRPPPSASVMVAFSPTVIGSGEVFTRCSVYSNGCEDVITTGTQSLITLTFTKTVSMLLERPWRSVTCSLISLTPGSGSSSMLTYMAVLSISW